MSLDDDLATREEVDFDYKPGESVGYLIRDTFRAFSKLLQSRIEPRGVTLGQWYLLRVLWEEDGLTQRELSTRVGIMEPTTVTALNDLEAAGLIKRVRNKTDRRKINVYLTPKGRHLKGELLPLARDVNEAATADLTSSDIQELRRLMRQIQETLGRSGARPA